MWRNYFLILRHWSISFNLTTRSIHQSAEESARKTAKALPMNINKRRSKGSGRHRRSIPNAMGEDINQKWIIARQNSIFLPVRLCFRKVREIACGGVWTSRSVDEFKLTSSTLDVFRARVQFFSLPRAAKKIRFEFQIDWSRHGLIFRLVAFFHYVSQK